jgi:lipoprotein-anchoring transpeptidase ErfK/SrfK
MAEPPDPTMPSGPDDGADGWVRPSQRRASRPRSGPPSEPPSEPPTTAYDPVDPVDPLPEPDPDPTEAIAAPATAAADARLTAPRQRRRARQRNRRRAAMAAGALAVVLAIVAAFALSGGGGTKAIPTAQKSLAPTTTTLPAAPPPALVATTKVPSLQVFDQPAATSKVVTTLTAKTDYGLPRTLLATAVQPGWVQVLLPIRPNSSRGWIRTTDVTTTTTDYQVRIVLSTHHLTLMKAGAPVLSTAIVVGKAQTPTPTGLFYVTDPLDLQAQPNGAYGAFALGLSGFSNVLTSFNGGPGQIAVHGTPYADQVGQDLSNGCVRVPNALILQIAKLVPLGTPVAITA